MRQHGSPVTSNCSERRLCPSHLTERQHPGKGPGSQAWAADTHLGHGHLKHDVLHGLGGRAHHGQQQHLHPGVAGGPGLGKVQQDPEAAAVAHHDGRQAACGEGARHHPRPRLGLPTLQTDTPPPPHPELAAAFGSEEGRDPD